MRLYPRPRPAGRLSRQCRPSQPVIWQLWPMRVHSKPRQAGVLPRHIWRGQRPVWVYPRQRPTSHVPRRNRWRQRPMRFYSRPRHAGSLQSQNALMSSSGSVKLRHEKCLEVWGNAKQRIFQLSTTNLSSSITKAFPS